MIISAYYKGYKMIKISFLTTIAFTAALTLTGCGGGGGSSNSSGTTTESASGTESGSGGTERVPYKCSDSYSAGGISMETKSGYIGDIAYDCKIMSASHGVHLNVSPITITALTKVVKIDGTEDNRKVNGTANFDYKAATVHYAGSADGIGHFDCVETYKPFLPVTISSDNKMEEFLMNGIDPKSGIDLFDKDGSNFVSTTCPENYYDDKIPDEPTSMNAEMTTDISIKDAKGKTDKLSIYLKVKK